jgi:hypothetical protein
MTASTVGDGYAPRPADQGLRADNLFVNHL